MESTSTKTAKSVEEDLIHIPNLQESSEGWSVGHAGMYPVEDDASNKEAVVVDKCLTLGLKTGKVLIDCERNIKLFVSDVLAKKLVDTTTRKNGEKSYKLGDFGLTLDDVKHLPNSELGVWIHYLTEGIARDFNMTWEETPTSLREKKTVIEKAAEKGKRIMSKKEKNELLAKRSYEYWEEDIKSGKITEEEADIFMKEAREEVRKLEDAGFFLSPRKTEGVSLFDWRTEIKEKLNEDDSVIKIYNRHSVIPLVPCLENKLDKLVINKKVKKEVDKSIVAGVPFTDGASFMEERIEGWKKLKEHYEPRTFHIAKINQKGKTTIRWFVVDAIKKATGKQVLLMWDDKGVDGILE